MNPPKFSVVTISFNQKEFLERAISSVITQDYANIEYIVVDPGSTDGSRELIDGHRANIAKVILEPDEGAADGLNHGFACATGDIFCYLNSDDEFEPGAFRFIADEFARRPSADVLCGHGYVVDKEGRILRRIWSDSPAKYALAYGTSIQIQPSTFIRREAFQRAKGFNIKNKSNWDGELILSLIESGARIEIVNAFLSKYRLHDTSITGTGSIHKRIKEWQQRRFEMLMGRKWNGVDHVALAFFKLYRQVQNPRAFAERLFRGKVYRRSMR